jgi:hydrogenase-4 component E
MTPLLDPLLIAALALNFIAVGVSRIRAVVGAVALQGVILGLCPLLIHPEIEARGIVLVAAAVVLKGLLIPSFLRHAMREARTQHEVTPTVGFMASMLLNAVGSAAAMAFSRTLPLADEHADLPVVPAALATIWTGFLMLTTRRKPLMQVLGYLILENGIFLFGLLLLEAMPALVEAGILLDLFTAVFIMAIIVHNINREFGSLDAEHLSELKD